MEPLLVYCHAYYNGITALSEDTDMARIESVELSPGTPAPDFTLPDTVSGNDISLAALSGKPILIVFMCNHCPYVIHLLNELVVLVNEAAIRGVNTIAISANDIERYPQDRPQKMQELARQHDVRFPYCFDESQQVARAYGAVCTPDIFLFDGEHHLYYHGQFDDTRPGRGLAHGADLRQAIDSLLKGLPAPEDTQPSVGCSIKWKP